MHNRAMPRHLLRRYLPHPTWIREHRALRPVSRWLNEPELWHLHRRSVSGAVFIGLFCAFLPLPFQMVIAASLAVLSRCNVPIAVVLVWVSNPITMPPMLFFSYQLGAWLLNRRIEVATIELNWAWLSAHIGQIGGPLLFGSLLCGWVAGLTGMVVVRVLWRLHVVKRWRARRLLRRAARQSGSDAPPAAPVSTPTTGTGSRTSGR
jgi:uncharacterized protein